MTTVGVSVPSGKVFNDSIHGHVFMPSYCVRVIDTPHYQRLRDLKQLGAVYWTFPGACHNRFEHSIGTAYLAGAMVTNLLARDDTLALQLAVTADEGSTGCTARSGALSQLPETVTFSAKRTHHCSATEVALSGCREIERDLRLVRLAGLCHDLGHGPFSHVFDHQVLPRRGITDDLFGRFHEQRSTMLLRHLCHHFEVALDRSEEALVADIILGRIPPTSERLERRFLFSVVNNQRSGVDVDKFDYLTRDARYTLPRSAGFDYERFLRFSRIIDDEICYHIKEANNLYDMFSTRMRMHKMVYNHRAVKACEFMITDALVLADEHLGLSRSIQDPEAFLQLSDWVLKRIEFATEAALAPAKALVQQLQRRELYRFVAAALIPDSWPTLSAEDVTAWQQDGSVQLRPEDLIVHYQVINYGKHGGADPVEQVRFFIDWFTDETIGVRRDQVSSLIPVHFEERMMMVYSRNREPRYVHSARQAFERLLQRRGGLSPSHRRLVREDQLPYLFPESKARMHP
ncbi:SAM domain and HD [Cyanidiococcus yangmingshanensis]|uniref:SAM domain and HD n=1 Tax=Cyanidiococcus yangmingshanensis TaxID=2690220 RepID=A0A7J7IDN5_9RHOD|nr:SAM domain and HD [Cyanidiococcus yangmingshanensis]